MMRKGDSGFGTPATLEELMSLALRIELDAVERYRELADAMDVHNNPAVAMLFRTMADIEGRHVQRLLATMGWASPPPLPAGAPSWAVLESPESIPHDATHYLMQPHDALAIALAGEERAAQFFDALAKALPTDELRAATRAMAEEEREHVALVRAWIARLPPADLRASDDPDPPRYLD